MTPLQELRSMFEINYFNTLLFTQYIAKKMIAKNFFIIDKMI